MKDKLDKKGARLLFFISWFAYFCAYLGRLNYSGVMSVLIGDSLTKAQAGWVNTAFLASYALGQMVNGILAERWSPAWMVFIGVMGAGAANIAFAFAGGFEAMLFLRLLTGYFASMLWPALLSVMVRRMSRQDVMRASVDMTSSMAAGSLASYGLCAWFLEKFSWQWAFVAPGAALVAAGVMWAIFFPRLKGEKGGEIREEAAPSPEEKQGRLPLVRLIAIPALLWAIPPAVLHGAIKDGVSAWVPTFIREVFHKSASFSAMVTILLPLVNLCGAYLARFVYGWTGHNVFRSAFIFFGAAVAGFLLMLTLGGASLALTIICFALITSFMMGVNVLLVNFLPLEFERYGRTATVSGGLNAIAYLGSALVSGMTGVLSGAWGWNGVVVSWCMMMAAALIFCLAARGASTFVKEERPRPVVRV